MKWSNLSLGWKFFIAALLQICISLLAIYIFSRSVYQSEKVNQARTLAEMVEVFGQWASKYGGVWVKHDTPGDFLYQEAYLTQPAGKELTPDDLKKAISYFSKNPALVQRELAEVTEQSPSRAKFRLTSDNYMNRNNKPNSFELRAIEQIKEQQATEYAEVKQGQLLFAKRIVMAKACLKCHESPEKAPSVVTQKYGREGGYGFKEGDVAGIISIRIPFNHSITAVGGAYNASAWFSLAGIVLASFIPIVLVMLFVVKPLRSLSNLADKASKTRPESLGTLVIQPQDFKSHDEIVRFKISLHRLLASLKMWMTDDQQKR